MGLLDRLTNKQTEEGAKKKAASSDKTSAKTTKAKPAAKKSAAAVEAGKETAQGKTASAQSYRTIIRPMITEKSSQAAALNKYSFLVARSANKRQISQAVTALYGTKPLAVNVINTGGRKLRFGKSAGRRSDYKKAIVTLPKGSSITIHEGV